MESKAGKKKRSSSGSSDSNHSPALLAVIADLRPWGSVKWKDPALGDVRFGLFVVLPSLSPASRCPRNQSFRRWPVVADGAGLQLTMPGVLAVREEAILTGHGRVTEVILFAV